MIPLIESTGLQAFKVPKTSIYWPQDRSTRYWVTHMTIATCLILVMIVIIAVLAFEVIVSDEGTFAGYGAGVLNYDT